MGWYKDYNEDFNVADFKPGDKVAVRQFSYDARTGPEPSPEDVPTWRLGVVNSRSITIDFEDGGTGSVIENDNGIMLGKQIVLNNNENLQLC